MEVMSSGPLWRYRRRSKTCSASGVIDGLRTRSLRLGRPLLCQLSYYHMRARFRALCRFVSREGAA